MNHPSGPPVGHQELAAILREDILAGRLAVGSRIPSETRLSQEYGVSVKTVRAAVRLLRSEGLVHAVFGKGVVVSGPPEREDLFVDEGTAVSSRPATQADKEALGMRDTWPEGWPVLQIEHPDGTGDVVAAHKVRVVFVNRGGSGDPTDT